MYLRILHIIGTKCTSTNLVTASFDEVLISTGELNYITLIQEVSKLPKDTPAILERLSRKEEYNKAVRAVRTYARNIGMLM